MKQMATDINTYASLPSPLPEAPQEDIFTSDQWAILLAIADTVIPSIQRESNGPTIHQLAITDSEYADTVDKIKKSVQNSPDDKVLTAFLEERPSEVPAFCDLLKRSFAFYVYDDTRRGVGASLSALK
jgi:hypothetical protein